MRLKELLLRQHFAYNKYSLVLLHPIIFTFGRCSTTYSAEAVHISWQHTTVLVRGWWRETGRLSPSQSVIAYRLS